MLLKTSENNPGQRLRARSNRAGSFVPRLLLLLGLPPLAFCALSVQAFDMDSDVPIAVSANNARLDDNAGKATYSGNVVIAQAGTRLFADRVELYRDEEGLSRILAYGDPARYEQAEAAENPATDARANEIVFDSVDNVLTFRDNAVIEQAGDIFRGDIIRYDTEDRVVTAERGESEGSSQVEMVIQPRRSSGRASDQGDSDGAAQSE